MHDVIGKRIKHKEKQPSLVVSGRKADFYFVWTPGVLTSCSIYVSLSCLHCQYYGTNVRKH